MNEDSKMYIYIYTYFISELWHTRLDMLCISFASTSRTGSLERAIQIERLQVHLMEGRNVREFR